MMQYLEILTLWLMSRCFRNDAADEENFKELNALPGEVDIIVADDNIVTNESEHYRRLRAAEFWTHCRAIQEIT
jgi:hypothetical protein